MSRQVKTTYVTPEEYLSLERKAESKSEYLDGEIFAMTGASKNHNFIAGNVFSALKQHLRERPCEIYISDMRVKIPSANLYTYPDVAVVCGESQFEDDAVDTLLNPTLIVEVLSKSTAAYDRTTKFGYYRTLVSVAEYLLIAQNGYHVEHYVKQPDNRWMLSDFRSLEDVLQLDSVQCSLALGEIYYKVSLS
ncbi:MAG TPA: Uma2 family endonuclease [Pyrinomonadaceae bacterium]|jgi:Uma2 family endonuclease|nr:Uma2 family endonuclease [Pyrinomonadaceae bacterium]